MARRIDALYCTPEDAPEKIGSILEFVGREAATCEADIKSTFESLQKWLEGRQQSLLEQVREMASSKQQALKAQKEAIQKGTCAPAPPEDPEAPVDPNRYLLCTDGVIRFEGSMEDLKPHLDPFGKVFETSTYASHTIARGPAVDDAMRVDVESFVMVTAKDLNKVQRKDGGEKLDIAFHAVGQEDSISEEIDHTVEDLKDGRYRLTVTAKAAGQFQMRVAISSAQATPEAISGSPFRLNVLPPPNYAKIGVDRLGDAGKPWVMLEGEAGATLRHPSGMAFDRTGKYVFVSDQANDRVVIYDADTKAQVCVYGHKGSKPTDLDTPGYIVLDAEDRVYVSDMLNHRVQVLLFNPKLKSLWHHACLGGQGSRLGQFDFPRGLAVTEQGNLVVCDMGNKRVQVLDVSKEWAPMMSLEGPQEMTPLDVAVNRQGDILVACGNEHCIHVFTDGVHSRTFGKRGGKDGLFRYPAGITVDEMDMLFVCDQGNKRMQILSASDGSYVHQWKGWAASSNGQEGAEEEGDDTPPASPEPDDPDAPDTGDFMGIKSPAGVAVNSQGLILVSDYSRHLVFSY